MALTNGLVVMTPSSVAKTGASSTATINSDGSVTFGSCETLSLNGVFTSAYDNYMVVIRNTAAQTGQSLLGKLRVGGSDSSTGYTRQLLEANATSISAARFTDNAFGIGGADGSNTSYGGYVSYWFGPSLSQPTACRTIGARPISSAYIGDDAGTHSVSTAYDGLTVIAYGTGNNATGIITVFGFNQ